MRTIFITGCSTGIGLDTALFLKEKGWKVIASCRKEEDVKNLQNQGLECLKVDVTKKEDLQNAFDYLQNLERLDAIFCNAGFGQPGFVEDIPLEALEEIFATNVFGVWECIRLAMPIFRKQNSGKIIINSSILGFTGMPFRGAYNSTKYALEGLADTLRCELKGSNIFVSLLEPGPITSNFRKTAQIKLEQYIDLENSVHKEFYKSKLTRFTKPDMPTPFTLPARACSIEIFNALNSIRPKRRIQVTFPTKLFWILKRILPTSIFDFLSKKFGS